MTSTLRALAALLVAVAGLVAVAPAAAAHVTVSTDSAEPGHFAKAMFRVPNERDDASTVRLEVSFPRDAVLGNVSVAAVPGWTAAVTKRALTTPVRMHGGEITEAVESIAWRGGEIRPGEFLEFPVSVGPLPHGTDRLVFKALQSYSDGEVVRWIDVPADGAPEPEHPAPVLSLAADHPTETHTGSADAFARVVALIGMFTAFGALTGVVVVVLGRRWATRPPTGAPGSGAGHREKATV